MIETDDITVDQAQNFIRMEDLLAAMDGGALDMQNQLCYCCSFIIQCNDCLGLFRSLPKFFIHKEESCFTDKSCEDELTANEDYAASFEASQKSSVLTSDQLAQSDNNADVFLETVASSEEQTPVENSKSDCLDLRFAPENISTSDGFTNESAHKERSSETKKEEAAEMMEESMLTRESTNDLDDTPFIAMLVECEFCSELFQSEEERLKHMAIECPYAEPVQYRRKYDDIGADIDDGELSPKRRKVAYEQDDDFEIQPNVKQKFEKKLVNLYCEICDRQFKSSAAATKHRKKVHKDGELFVSPSINSFECSECFKNYATKKNLERHRAFVHGLTSSVAIADKTSNKSKSTQSRKERKEVDLNNQENTSPVPDGDSSSVKPTKKQVYHDFSTPRISDEELLIYYDHDTKQCLICCGHFDTLKAIRNHIKYAHAEHVSSEDIVLESHANRLQNEVASFPEEMPSTLPDSYSSSKSNTTGDRNYVCSLCGKHFYVLQEYETHIALPHKIAIKS